MRVILIDTAYPDFLAFIPFDKSSTYDVELRKVLDWKFGTFDAMSTNLRAFGHECIDVIANHYKLQQMWTEQYGLGTLMNPVYEQILNFQPDVLFLQDLSLIPAANLNGLANRYVISGQCSCPWPGDGRIKECDVIFSSFPHYIPRIEALGVRAVYLPLAFEPSVLEGPQPERDIDISFVGGVGASSHWKRGTDTLEAVAAAFKERFHFYGYGIERLPASSALRGCYKGAAFGRDMYSIYRRSKIVINRHGEVAQGFANNLRMYEATGAGAMLLTDNKTNLFAYGEIESYSTPKGAIEKLHFYLDDKAEGMDWRAEIADRGQRRTLHEHAYKNRMQIVSKVLSEMLCPV